MAVLLEQTSVSNPMKYYLYVLKQTQSFRDSGDKYAVSHTTLLTEYKKKNIDRLCIIFVFHFSSELKVNF